MISRILCLESFECSHCNRVMRLLVIPTPNILFLRSFYICAYIRSQIKKCSPRKCESRPSQSWSVKSRAWQSLNVWKGPGNEQAHGYRTDENEREMPSYADLSCILRVCFHLLFSPSVCGDSNCDKNWLKALHREQHKFLLDHYMNYFYFD